MKPIIGLLLMFAAFAASATTISDKYTTLGGSSGFLGKPTIPEKKAPDGVGRYRHYQNGSIYWHPDTGAHEVHGLIRQKWAEIGWELSELGYPISDEIDLVDGSGKISRFLNGEILWKSATNAVSVVQAKDLVIDLPFPTGVPWNVGVTQSDHHANAWAYCFDFNLASGASAGAPFVSVADSNLTFVDESLNGEGEDSVVTQRLGEGRYAAYLHLAKGGYTKKAKTGSGIVLLPQDSGGKFVKTGTVIGEIGVKDHLHFCVTTSPDRHKWDPYESVPVAFRNYSVSKDQGKSWTFVPVGFLVAGQWVRREPPKAGVPAGPQVTGNAAVISHGTVKVRVFPGDGKATGNGKLTIAVVAPWNEVLKTATKDISPGTLTGPWDVTIAGVPAYPGLKVRVEYKGAWSRDHDFVNGESEVFDLPPGATREPAVSLKTTLIH